MKNQEILFNKPTISKKDLVNVLECMISEQVANGELSKVFAKDLATFVGHKNMSAVSSPSAALALILKYIKVESDNEVILSAFCEPFVAEAIVFSGAKPIPVDIAENSWLIDLEKVKSSITPNTKAIIVSHLFGYPARLLSFYEYLSTLDHKVYLIEDCSHSLGTTVDGMHLGGIGDYSFFSFSSSSIMTTANGGAIATRLKKDIVAIEELANPVMGDKILGRIDLTLTDIQSAMGISEISLLDKFITQRRKIGKYYQECAERGKNKFLPAGESVELNFYRFPIVISSSLKIAKEFFKKYKIEAEEPFRKTIYEYLELPDEEFPHTRQIRMKTLCVPLYPALKHSEVEEIGKLVTNIR